MRRLGITIAAVAIAAALMGGGAAVWARAQKRPRVQGIDISLKVSTDPNYCLEEETDGSVAVAICVARDDQHFAFTDNPDGTNVLVLGDGQCLDRGNGRPNTPVHAAACDFGATQRFKFLPDGKLADPAVTVCVEAAQAAQGAHVFDNRCHASLGGDATEMFLVSH